MRLDGLGSWMASFSRAERVEYSPEENDAYEEEFGGKAFGDRRIELVIIGVDMDNTTIIQMLDSALLTEDEFSRPESWKHMKDVFPLWM